MSKCKNDGDKKRREEVKYAWNCILSPSCQDWVTFSMNHKFSQV